MSDTDLRFFRGETPTFRITATKEDFTVAKTDPNRITPIDLRVAGTKLRFTAKRSKGDAYADAVISKGNTAAGLTGIEVVSADPGNLADLSLDAADTDDLTAPVKLVYDIELETSGGDLSILASGLVTIDREVTDAA